MTDSLGWFEGTRRIDPARKTGEKASQEKILKREEKGRRHPHESTADFVEISEEARSHFTEKHDGAEDPGPPETS